MSEEDIKKKQSKINIDAQGKKKALAKFLEDYYGRALLWELLDMFGTDRSVSFADPTKMAAYSGLRDAGLKIRELILEVDAKYLYQMMSEAKNREQK